MIDAKGNKIINPDYEKMTNGDVMAALERDETETKSSSYRLGYLLGSEIVENHYENRQEPEAAKADPDTGLSKIKRPSYYNRGGIECRAVIRAWQLGFNLGNALKYICRAGLKESKEEDLKKAIQYLMFELEEEQESNDQNI